MLLSIFYAYLDKVYSIEPLMMLVEEKKRTIQDDLAKPFLGRENELQEFETRLLNQMAFCRGKKGKYPIVYCSNLSGLGKTTFGKYAFYMLKDKGSKPSLRSGLKNGMKICIDFNGGKNDEYATAFELEQIRKRKPKDNLPAAFLAIRLLAKYFGYNILTFFETFIGGATENYWNAFLEESCSYKVLLKICENLTINSIIYVHIDEPQLLVKQISRWKAGLPTLGYSSFLFLFISSVLILAFL